MKEQMELFNDGGLRDEGGTVDPESGNEVPSGSLQKEVADDIPVMISEGEFVFPADVVRYIGLETLMKMRQDAKQGLKMMEKMGQMGNSEEAELPDDMPFGMADLIVVGSAEEDEEEKAEGGVIGMQTGGLLDDPRFKSPTTPTTPTLTDEDKKEIEDSLLGTVYGTITMKRYVNADGVVKYIPFIGDEPQMAIPEGFEVDDSAPTPKSSIGATAGDSGGSDDSGGAVFTSGVNNPFADQGTASFNINTLDSKDLIEYYGSFSSPINRFLTVGVGALFGGVPALGMAAMQQLAQTRGPNSLRATEDLIAQKIKSGEIKGDLLNRLKELQKRAKEKGTAPKSFLASLIGKVSEGNEQKKSNLQSAIEAGNVSGVNSEVADVDRSAFKVIDVSPVASDITPEEEGAEFVPAPIYKSAGYGFKDPKKGGDFTQIYRPQTLAVPDRISPERQEQYRTQREARAMVDDIDRKVFGEGLDVPSENFALDMTELRGVTKSDAFKRQFLEPDMYPTELAEQESGFADTIRAGSPYETEGRRQLGTPTEEMPLRTKKRTRKADQSRTGILPRRGERFPDVGLDRPSKLGQNRVDDFMLGVQRDDKGNVANLTEQQQKNIRSNVQEQENIRKKIDKEDKVRQERGFGPMSVQERFDRQQEEFTGFDSQGNFLGGAKGGMFYVGGVPTKPMKPQRLKKGGLAKPKVKPKRMKKGGLASKK